MFIIFGTRSRVKDLGQAMHTCERCRRETVHSFGTQQLWFTLFFIPVFPLSRKRMLGVCNLCGQMLEYSGVDESLFSTTSTTSSCPYCAATISTDAAMCGQCNRLLTGHDPSTATSRFWR